MAHEWDRHFIRQSLVSLHLLEKIMLLSKGESERFTNLTPHSLIDPVIYYVMEDIFYRAPSSIIQCPRSYALPKWL